MESNKEGEVICMLLEFSCSNHKSIKDRVTFSAVAGKDTTNEDLLFQYGSVRVLKNAVIYGANGSGKSNLIDAIAFVRKLVINSIKNQPGQGIKQQPHKLAGIDTDSTYSIQFITKGVRYAFGFSIRNALVVEEYLYCFPKMRQVKIYERDADDFYPGDKFKGKFDTCKDTLKPNRLLLSCAANFSSIQEIEDVFKFFRNDLVIYRGLGVDNWMDYSLQTMHKNADIKAAVLEFMRSLGTGIVDVKIKIDKQEMSPDDLPPFLSDDFKVEIAKRMVNRIEAKVVYDTFEVDLLQEESTGIRKLFEFICPLIDIIVRGKVLICDELETNFHEAIVYKLVDLFRNLKTKQFAQMFFTTHDTSILSLDLFRRDQIWFTELRQGTRATDLYSLAEIKNVRKDENIGKGYISGKYGAIPMLNKNLADTISGMSSEGEANG